MTAPISLILDEIVTGCISTFLTVLKVLIPLLIFVEFLHTYRIMEKLSSKLSVITKLLGITPKAILPLLVATIMGVTYGTGTLIEMNERDPLPRKDFVMVGVFFFICHGVIETAAIWGSAGANVLMISVGRLIFAIVFTMIISRLPFFKSPANEVEHGTEKVTVENVDGEKI